MRQDAHLILLPAAALLVVAQRLHKAMPRQAPLPPCATVPTVPHHARYLKDFGFLLLHLSLHELRFP